MGLLAIIIVAAAEAGGDDGGIVASGTITVGASVVTGILTYLATKRHTEKTCESVRKAVPNPLEVELKDKFVSRREFDQHCQASDSAMKAHISDNERNFEALYNQMRANDKLTAKISGCLEAIQGDLSLIKTKLFGGKK